MARRVWILLELIQTANLFVYNCTVVLCNMLSLFCYLQRLVTLDTNEFEMNMFKIQEVFPLKVGEKLITCIDLDLYCKMDVSIGQ